MQNEQAPLVSSELATLWILYQDKTMMKRVVEHFLSHNRDPEATEILKAYYKKESNFVNEIRNIFKQEGAAIPVGFTENDVNYDAPQLFDDIFEVMYLRTMMKMATGINALHLSMSYRQDIIDICQRYSVFTESVYEQTTQMLLHKGILPKPPYVNVPHQAEFAKGKGYRAGFKLTGHKRTLNTVEVAYLHQSIETNIAGMKLMTGFAQVANEKDIRQYFVRGKELSKTIISKFSDMLLDSDINPSSAAEGGVTDSTISPFSDKLMMYNTSLLSNFGLGSNAIGSSFSLRKDLPLKMLMIAKDVIDFANDGGDLMIEHGFMEEPPQMTDRRKLSKG